jgi:hypothetical protein
MELSKAKEEAKWPWPGLEDVGAAVRHGGGARRLSITTAAARATAGHVGRPVGATSSAILVVRQTATARAA